MGNWDQSLLRSLPVQRLLEEFILKSPSVVGRELLGGTNSLVCLISEANPECGQSLLHVQREPPAPFTGWQLELEGFHGNGGTEASYRT